jgi:hypothetical protein
MTKFKRLDMGAPIARLTLNRPESNRQWPQLTNIRPATEPNNRHERALL